MLGGHVIKTGCRPVLSDLAAKGFVTHFASSGAAAIHDTEQACFDHTSEDVAEQLKNGSFGWTMMKRGSCQSPKPSGIGISLETFS